MRKKQFERLTEKKKEKYRKHKRQYMNKRYGEDHNFREKRANETKRYRNTKKGKSYVSEYNKRPEVKKRVSLWRKKNRKELSRKHLEYVHRPEVHARIKKQRQEKERKNKKKLKFSICSKIFLHLFSKGFNLILCWFYGVPIVHYWL